MKNRYRTAGSRKVSVNWEYENWKREKGTWNEKRDSERKEGIQTGLRIFNNVRASKLVVEVTGSSRRPFFLRFAQHIKVHLHVPVTPVPFSVLRCNFFFRVFFGASIRIYSVELYKLEAFPRSSLC